MQTKTISRHALLTAASVFICLPTHGEEAVPAPIVECVGRSEFSLPGDASAALYPLEMVAKLAAPPAFLVQASFPDGQVAGYTQWEYRGGLYVTPVVEPAQGKELLRRFNRLKLEARSYAAHHKVDDLRIPQSFEDLSGPAREAWRRATGYDGTWNLSGVILHWSSTYGPDTAQANAQAYRWLTNSRPRAPFEMPTGQGVCLPSLFIPDDGRVDRFIASTYRLKEHPDVTVWVQDRDWADSPSEGELHHLRQSVQDSVFFWTQNYQVAKAKGLKPVDRDQLLDMAEAVMRSVKVRSSVVP